MYVPREATVRQRGGDMNGGVGREAVGGQHHAAAAPVQVPVGWQRRAERGRGVVYVSPSGSVLASYDLKAYLLTDGTCKCGLECPLILHKVFNFDPGALVKQRTPEDVRSDADVTKLCIHKRKLLAVATLHRSIEAQWHGPGATGTGAPAAVSARSTTPRAIRPLNPTAPDCSDPFRRPCEAAAAGRGAQHGDLYPGLYYPRQHRGLGIPEAGPRSPYRAVYGGAPGPPPSGSRPHGDGPRSPGADGLGSHGGRPLGCPGADRRGFPGAAPVMRGDGRTPLSPPAAVTGRTCTPLSPMATAQSPVVNAPRGLYPEPPRQPVPPGCVLVQKRPVTSSEKDPLGILDPIPSKPGSRASAASPSPAHFQLSLHSQVPMMNVSAPPPTVVPLPSNLPLPTGRSGPAGHVQRAPRAGLIAATASSFSTSSMSPITSPVHVSGRTEASPHPLDMGNFATPSGHHAHPGGTRAGPPRSPASAVGSQQPALPSSPSSLHHQYKEPQAPPAGAQQHNNPMFSPMSSSSCSSSSPSSLSTPSASQKGHPGLLGVPLNQILSQQKSASFPASSLLSAAAKAQLAYQNKHTAAGNGTGNMVPGAAGGVHEVVGRQPGFQSSPRGMEGPGAPNPMLPPNSTVLRNTSEAQSGRAALRDKLMAQQRDASRKHKQSSGHRVGDGGGNNNAALHYSLLNQTGAGGARIPGPGSSSGDQLRKVALPAHNTSVAQLLQSMSHQGPPHSMAVSGQGPRLDAGPRPPPPPGASPLHHHHLAPQRAWGPRTTDPGVPLTHPSPQQQSLLLHSGRRTNVAAVAALGVGDGRCGAVDTGTPSSLSCSMAGDSVGVAMYQQQLQQQHQQQQHLRQQFQRGMQPAGPPHPAHRPAHPYPGHPPYAEGTDVGAVPCVYQNYQGMTANHDQYGDRRPQQREHPSHGEGLPVGTAGGVFPSGGGGGGPEAVDAIYRAVVDAASRGVHVTITAALSGTTQTAPSPAPATMIAFAGGLQEAEATSRGRPAESGWPQKTPDLGRGTPHAGGDPSSYYFHPLSHETPRGQWDGETQHSCGSDGRSGGHAAVWAGEDFLECSTQVRSSPCTERPVGLAPAPPCPAAAALDYQKGFLDNDGGGGYHTSDHVVARGPAHYREGAGQHFVPRGGGYSEVPGPARQELTGDERSPGSSTSLEGPLATGRDYYGPYTGSYDSGAAASPSDTRSLSSEEELRQPDSPSSEPLRYRSGSFRVGQLVWGPLRGLAPWAGRLAGGGHLREQAKVEPEKLKTLTHDLEAFERATKRNRKTGKLNNHLEAAIHEAMSELDKMSGAVHQMPSRERQVRPPKRRKISR